MLRLTLIFVLIAVTASTKHVKQVKRQPDDNLWSRCYRENYPIYKCLPRDCTYPTFVALERVWRVEDYKRILLKDDNLEQLCSEAGAVLDCTLAAYKASTDECKQDYNKHINIGKLLNNGAAFLEELCDDDVIESIRNNLDCILDEKLLHSADRCIFPNKDRNCSGISQSDNYDEINACYQSRWRRTCNVDEVVECASKKVTAECDEEAGELTELIGNAIFETLEYPICPDYSHLKTFLSYFKK